MKRLFKLMLLVSLAGLFLSCSHPLKKVSNLQLGMMPEDVEDVMGKPYAIRSAKIFDTEDTTMVWEYWPPFLAANQEKVHVVFENQRVVQWGVAGDYATGSEKNVTEYKAQKK